MLEDKDIVRTSLSHLGEFGLIEHLAQFFPVKHAQTRKAIGDDAAVISRGDGNVSVITTDFLLEGVHFDLGYVPLKHLGYKAVIVNLSDIYAMNAVPYGITVSIAVSNRFPLEAVEELYAGIQMACDKYEVELLGGDTSSSRQGLVISVTAYGSAPEKDIVYRSGAQPNDLVCVTGDLGAAYAGFLVLDREKIAHQNNPHDQPDLEMYDYVIGRQLKPESHPRFLQNLKDLGLKPNAMIDISDGLASELHHICKQSNCGTTIYADKIPIDHQTVSTADEFKISPVTFALNGGEDYELLMTFPLADLNKIKDIPEISIIGHITPESKQLQIVLNPGDIASLEAQGWKHF